MEKEKLITQTWLPVFPGFYCTIFDNDKISDYEEEYIRETVQPMELAKCMIENIYESEASVKFYKEYQESVSKQCVSIIWNELKSLGYVSNIEFEKICSPQYYNFVNDSINIKVTFSAENIRNIKAMIEEHEDEWNEYLKQVYTSRDGFISCHSNSPDAEEWNIETALTDSHNAGAILDFICAENSITDETLYYFCEQNVSVDTDLLKKECLEKGWYVPKHVCKDWLKSWWFKLRNKYSFKRHVTLGHPTQYIFETHKQRYIFCISREVPANDSFIVKRIFKIFMFAKLKEEKKR